VMPSWSMDHLVRHPNRRRRRAAPRGRRRIRSARRDIKLPGVPVLSAHARGPIGGLRRDPRELLLRRDHPDMDAAVRAAARFSGLGARVAVPSPIRGPHGHRQRDLTLESAALHARLARDRPPSQPAVGRGPDVRCESRCAHGRCAGRSGRGLRDHGEAKVRRPRRPGDPRAGAGPRDVEGRLRGRGRHKDGAILAAHASLQCPRTTGVDFAVRVFVGPTAAGPADRRPRVRRSHDSAARPRLPAGHSLASRGPPL
jgi:hypothetical protein